MIKIGKLIETAIKKFAIEEFPKEACGVITKKGKKLVAVKCENVSDDPEERFVISSNEYKGLIDTTGVYAIWHTHVDDKYPLTPSPTDIAACNATGVDWVVIDVKSSLDEDTAERVLEFGEFFHIAPKDGDDDYLERPYIYGVKDCFTLVRDYYQREFDIDVSFRAEGYPEITDWHDKGINMLVDAYKQADFVKLFNEEPRIGDLFLIQMSSEVSNHIAIYIGSDRILHHCMGRLSTEDVYGGGFWQKHTTHLLRHKNFMGDRK